MRILTGLILASALFVSPAFAQTPPPPGGGPREACKADVQSLCASVAGSDDRRAIGKCLRDNQAKLSQGCKDAMAARMAERGEGKGRGKGKGAPACRADAEKLCAGIQPGEGRIMACLKDKQAQVSDACKSEMAQMKSRTP
jgi:hypothetical protein